MSRAVVATAFGGPEVLAVVEEDLVAPAPGQVAIDVRAAGLNLADIKSYRGDFGRDESKLPLRLGSEASGVVTAVGQGAVGPAGPIAVGDKVIAYRISGAYADHVVVDAGAVLPKPDTLTFEEASGVLLTGVTAVHALTAAAVAPDDTVLIHAAAGGVGRIAVQLAVARGARVIGTAGPSNQALLRELGAEPVLYGDGLVDRVRDLAPDGIDAALDLIGNDEALDVSLGLVADRSRIATVANFSRGPAAGIKVLGGGPGADPGVDIRRAARLELVELAAAGKLRVFVERTFPLADVVAAHEALASGHASGKLVLVP